MMFKKISTLIILVLIVGVQGCASADNVNMKNLSKKEVQVGMTKQEVQEILGEPTKIRTSQESKFLDSDEEAWHYDKSFFSFQPKVVVIFKNGLVSDIDYIYEDIVLTFCKGRDKISLASIQNHAEY